ncbi:MAG: hypothetical protein ACK4N5_19515, partial [Myxococcales bacterium]
DRILFTVLAGTVAGAVGALATRLSERMWVGLTHRDPPQRFMPLAALSLKLGQELVESVGRVVPAFRAKS